MVQISASVMHGQGLSRVGLLIPSITVIRGHQALYLSMEDGGMQIGYLLGGLITLPMDAKHPDSNCIVLSNKNIRYDMLII